MMARGAAGVAGGLAGHRNEPPRIRTGEQCELQHAVHPAEVDLAVWDAQSVGRIQPVAPRAHDDLPHPVGRVRRTTRSLRAEALIVAHVRVDDQVGSRSIEVVPERLDRVGGPEAAGGSRVKPGPVPHGERALSRVRREIRPEPLLLRGASGGGDVGADAVEHDDVPGAEVVAVVTLIRVAGRGPEVVEGTGRAGAGVVLEASGDNSAGRYGEQPSSAQEHVPVIRVARVVKSCPRRNSIRRARAVQDVTSGLRWGCGARLRAVVLQRGDMEPSPLWSARHTRSHLLRSTGRKRYAKFTGAHYGTPHALRDQSGNSIRLGRARRVIPRNGSPGEDCGYH